MEAPLREGADFAMSSSHKVNCFKIPRKLASQGVDVEEFVDTYLMDDGYLLLERRREILAGLQEAAAKAKKPKTKTAKSDGSGSIMDRLKMAVAEGEGEEPPKKKAKGSAKDEDFKAMLKVYKKYHKDKVAELKDVLRWNKQLLGGTKEFVLFKVCDGVVHGRLWVCPLCAGDLKYMEGDYDKICCSGRYDEGMCVTAALRTWLWYFTIFLIHFTCYILGKNKDIAQRVPCSYTTPRLGCPESVRAHPFYTEEPSEEEKEAIVKLREEIREGGSGDGDNPVAQELLKAAKALDGKLDFGSNAGRKQAVGEFLALVEGKVDLPKNRNPKMEIGKLCMANSGKTAEEIMQLIFDKYGFAVAKVEKAAAKEAAAEAACANPKNAGLILALSECMKYYFAEKNSNAGSSYRKAIATLTTLEEEVTEDNAMSFSKGKTKLPGIGKGTAEKMLEFCRTGTFAKLEEKRAAHA